MHRVSLWVEALNEYMQPLYCSAHSNTHCLNKHKRLPLAPGCSQCSKCDTAVQAELRWPLGGARTSHDTAQWSLLGTLFSQHDVAWPEGASTHAEAAVARRTPIMAACRRRGRSAGIAMQGAARGGLAWINQRWHEDAEATAEMRAEDNIRGVSAGECGVAEQVERVNRLPRHGSYHSLFTIHHNANRRCCPSRLRDRSSRAASCGVERSTHGLDREWYGPNQRIGLNLDTVGYVGSHALSAVQRGGGVGPSCLLCRRQQTVR